MYFGRLLGAWLAVVALIAAPVFAQQPDPGSAPPPTAATAAATTAPADTAAALTTDAVPPAGGSAQPTAAGRAAPSTPAEPASMDGQTYTVRLRDLQQRIDQLKEQIRRSHTRLALLSETVLSGGASGSRSTIRLENKLSSQFQLTRALVVLDGQVQYNKTDRSGVLDEQKVIPVFSGSIPPGDHTVQVLINMQGSGYGVFSYLRGYRFEVRSSHSFTAVEGKTTRLRVIAFEKGDVTTPIEEQPAIRYVEKVEAGVAGGADASDKSSTP